jgi:predicted ATPase
MTFIERSIAIIEQRAKKEKESLPWLDMELIDQQTLMLKNKILILLIIKSERKN